jgi:sugar/nucleoside kinase (ribokinase family)
MALRVRSGNTRVAHEFVAVGHVTVDRLAGREQLGGSAFYSAILASRCGVDVGLVTAGEWRQLGEALEPYAEAMDVVVQSDQATTKLLTWTTGAERRQRVLARARDIDPIEISCGALHLAPVVREIQPAAVASTRPAITGITPQGLIRSWDTSGLITLVRRPDLDRYSADVAVLSQDELPYCEALVRSIDRNRGIVALTRAAEPAELRTPEGTREVEGFPVEARDDLGAGDVFAAALLLALRRGESPVEAVRFAHAAASLRVAGCGPSAVPTLRSIEALRAGSG